jgi:hypothetical protein
MSGESETIGVGQKVEETKQYAQEKAGQTQEATKVDLLQSFSI